MLEIEIKIDIYNGVHPYGQNAIGSVPSSSSPAVAYRWCSSPKVCRYRASSPQGSSSNGCCIFRKPYGQHLVQWTCTIQTVSETKQCKRANSCSVGSFCVVGSGHWCLCWFGIDILDDFYVCHFLRRFLLGFFPTSSFSLICIMFCFVSMGHCSWYFCAYFHWIVLYCR